ncbi:ciliated left-right organizer metallopeptidase isoform X5 [Scyliorhinus torazame]|uniref:ciliated left-right organizer metallopeptidase isoform X5 n=1 Tax=Scyliorhinus torazame TaxID=75743 RepID=UPI003B5948FC
MRPLAARGRRFLRAVSLLAAALCCAGRCIHDVTQRRVDTATAVRYDGGRGVGRSGRPPPPPPRPIRIATHFITVPNMVLSHVDRVRLNNSIQQAVSLLAKLLAVIPVVDNLLLSRDMNEYCKSVWRNASLPNFNKCFQRNDNYRKETCLDVVIPDDHLQGYSVWPGQGNSPTVIQEDGRGVPNADLILYIKAADTSKCRKERSVIAYAAYCKLDQNGRPIAGAVTFCHSRLRGSAFDHRRTMLTTVHELLHVLGFSKDLYNTWLDCASAPSIGMNCSSRSSVTNTDDQGSVRIYTRTVIQKMQQHFNSSSPELGGPLENGVQPGFPSSHWESRFLQGSIMTAAMGAPEHTFIDPITLAAMSDTGWYQVTYDTTQPLVWGQGQGDTFGLTSSCHDNSSEYFCTGSGMGCHYLYLNKGHCASDEFLDGCRVYKPLVNGNQTSDASEPMGGRCYLHRLAGAEKEFQVQVQGSPWLPCRAGESVQVPHTEPTHVQQLGTVPRTLGICRVFPTFRPVTSTASGKDDQSGECTTEDCWQNLYDRQHQVIERIEPTARRVDCGVRGGGGRLRLAGGGRGRLRLAGGGRLPQAARGSGSGARKQPAGGLKRCPTPTPGDGGTVSNDRRRAESESVAGMSLKIPAGSTGSSACPPPPPPHTHTHFCFICLLPAQMANAAKWTGA